MQDPTLRDEAAGDRLDADLVCEQCETVNEPGTLYCHNCGNNLRDQRQRRLAGGVILVLEERPDRSRIVLGALSVAGLLVVLYVAWNVNAIAEWMVGGQPRIDTNIYWQGPMASDFEAVSQELHEEPLSDEQLRSAHESPVPVNDLEGRFVVRQVGPVVDRTIGYGAARLRNGVVLFVVVLNSGAEVRGTARIEEGGRLTSSSITYALEGRTFGGVGFAVPDPNGGYNATGVSDLDDRHMQFRIYRVH